MIFKNNQKISKWPSEGIQNKAIIKITFNNVDIMQSHF